MKTRPLLLFCFLAATACLRSPLEAQIYDTNNPVVQTLAGSGFYGYYDGQGVQTMFNYPTAIAVDSSSNLFVLDNANYRIRKITPGGTVSTFAGGGQFTLPAIGTNANLSGSLNGPMTIDHSNVLWIAVSDNRGLIRIGPDAYVSFIPFYDYYSFGGICVDSGNNLYLSDVQNNKIYRYTTNRVLQVFAGSGNPGAIDGNWIFCSFSSPTVMTADAADNIYVWDSNNYLMRRINQNNDVETIAGRFNNSTVADGVGRDAGFGSISGMCVDPFGNLFCTSSSGRCVRRMTAATNVTTVAGSFYVADYNNGPGSGAFFSGATGICVSHGMIYVVDTNNQRIRDITFNPVPQLLPCPNVTLGMYPGLQIEGMVGRTYTIESSTNFTSWHKEVTLLLTRNPYVWFDSNSVGQKKFYRVFLLP